MFSTAKFLSSNMEELESEFLDKLPKKGNTFSVSNVYMAVTSFLI